jgi:hypothetical protein
MHYPWHCTSKYVVEDQIDRGTDRTRSSLLYKCEIPHQIETRVAVVVLFLRSLVLQPPSSLVFMVQPPGPWVEAQLLWGIQEPTARLWSLSKRVRLNFLPLISRRYSRDPQSLVVI